MNNLFLFLVLAGLSNAVVGAAAEPAPASAASSRSAAASGAEVVTLTPQNLALVTIDTETIARGSLATTLKAVARVSENRNKTAKVTSTLEGRLVAMNFDLNDRVQAGEVVGLVQTPELLGKPLALKAPIAGVIIERGSTVGELIGRDTAVYAISDPTDLWVLAEIKERDIGAVRVGQDATFTVLAYPEQAFHGRVVLVGNHVETATRTLEVRIAVDNRDGRLKPGMFADVEIATTALQDVLTVSDEALQTLGDDTIVFIALDGARFEQRVVRTGLEQRGRVQIVSGLRAGERVVTQGSFILKSELLKGELGEE